MTQSSSLVPCGAASVAAYEGATVSVDEFGVYRETHNCIFRQLFQEAPALKGFYTTFETRFDALPYVEWGRQNVGVAFGVCGVYLVRYVVATCLLFCVIGSRVMASRHPFQLSKSLAAWNLLLASFSAIGFVRTAPHLLYYMSRNGLYASVCMPAEPSFGQGACGLWTMLFIYSKVPELFDTVFVVLRKKPLIFLHWYHHVSVLLFCWNSYSSRSSAGLFFVVMNYGVHAIMYFYYFLTAIRIYPRWAPLVTVLQIAQMFVGISIYVAVYVFQVAQGRFCDVTQENFMAGILMYGSYALLFLHFAVGRYLQCCAGRQPRTAIQPVTLDARTDTAVMTNEQVSSTGKLESADRAKGSLAVQGAKALRHRR